MLVKFNVLSGYCYCYEQMTTVLLVSIRTLVGNGSLVSVSTGSAIMVWGGMWSPVSLTGMQVLLELWALATAGVSALLVWQQDCLCWFVMVWEELCLLGSLLFRAWMCSDWGLFLFEEEHLCRVHMGSSEDSFQEHVLGIKRRLQAPSHQPQQVGIL